jgi:putative membrane protein insertion efficiency factor
MNLVRSAVIRVLRLYKLLLSPLLPPACRFHPSCSEYAIEAVEVHGVPRGLWLSLRRLARCHPFRKGGFDPVPPPPATAGSKNDCTG